MSRTCQRCGRIVERPCQSDTETYDCPELRRNRAKALMRLETKVRAQGGVSDPRSPWECWAEKRVYTGSAFPAFAQCAKNRRPGYLTCRWHHDREDAAQRLKANAA